ncbi:antitoxin VbhA family protein [Aureimonas ureilytica]|uniref:antitoxin VbhA family protein n=1 Tax=Aureimonas ureilytica TaxID=401562 RepID=UPI000370ADFC|nr:antitoxin VbhA family protein [Aureimonas ureilytica]
MSSEHSIVPISESERARRLKAIDQARAANRRQGYVHDQALEDAKARYAKGEITLDELREQTLARFRPV